MIDTRAAPPPCDRVPSRARRRDAPPGGADALRRENEALRRHAARLSAAVRRIGASLDAAGARARRDGRSRAELLAAASRQLLTPVTSIKGSTAAALDATAALDRGGMLQLFRIIDEQAGRMGDLIGGLPEARGGRIGAGSGKMGEGSRPGPAGPAGDDRANGAELGGGRSGRTPSGTAGNPGPSGQSAPPTAAGPGPFRLGDLAVDHELRRVTVAGRRVDLTATEYELLRALSANPGGVSTADGLLRRVWGGRRAGDPNLLRTFVRRLRGKLGDDADRPAYIFTERGIGYRLAGPGDVAAPNERDPMRR